MGCVVTVFKAIVFQKHGLSGPPLLFLRIPDPYLRQTPGPHLESMLQHILEWEGLANKPTDVSPGFLLIHCMTLGKALLSNSDFFVC